jgi:hypothetical protein
MAPTRTTRPLWPTAALALVALPLLAAPAGAAPACLPGPRLACAEAHAAASVTCSVEGTRFTCTFATERAVAGSTQSPLPGEVKAMMMQEIGVCSGHRECDQVTTFPGGGCTWAVRGHQCTAAGRSTETRTGTVVGGCLDAWVTLRVESHSVAPGTGTDLVAASDFVTAEYKTC